MVKLSSAYFRMVTLLQLYVYYLYGGPPKNHVTSLCFKPMFWDGIYIYIYMFDSFWGMSSPFEQKTWVG